MPPSRSWSTCAAERHRRSSISRKATSSPLSRRSPRAPPSPAPSPARITRRTWTASNSATSPTITPSIHRPTPTSSPPCGPRSPRASSSPATRRVPWPLASTTRCVRGRPRIPIPSEPVAVTRWPGAAPADIPVWDCHGHLYDDPGGARGTRLLTSLDRLGIERLFVSRLCADNRVPATATPADFRRANRAIQGWTEKHPDRFIPYYFVSCVYPEEAERELEDCVEQRGFKGLKLYAACRYDDPRVEPVVARAARYGIPTLLHVVQRRVQESPGQYVSDGREVAHLAQRLPTANLIMAHVGGGGDWRYSVKLVKPYTNVYVDR